MKFLTLIITLFFFEYTTYAQVWEKGNLPNLSQAQIVRHKGSLFIGEFRSNDNGETWTKYITPTTFSRSSYATYNFIGCNDSAIFYMGIGERCGYSSVLCSSPQREIFMSKDTGKTFSSFDYVSGSFCTSWTDSQRGPVCNQGAYIINEFEGFSSSPLGIEYIKRHSSTNTSLWFKPNTGRAFELQKNEGLLFSHRQYFYKIQGKQIFRLDTSKTIVTFYKNEDSTIVSFLAIGDTFLLNNGTIRSYNNGQTWLINQPYLGDNLRVAGDAIFSFSNQETHFTTDLVNWIKIPFACKAVLKSDSELILSDNNGTVRSTDNGRTFKILKMQGLDASTTDYFDNIQSLDSLLIIQMGNGSLTSSDQAKSWQPVFDSQNGFYSIFSPTVKGDKAYALSLNFKGADGLHILEGNTVLNNWKSVSIIPDFYKSNTAQLFSDKDNLYLFTQNAFNTSGDNGKTWRTINRNDSIWHGSLLMGIAPHKNKLFAFNEIAELFTKNIDGNWQSINANLPILDINDRNVYRYPNAFRSQNDTLYYLRANKIHLTSDNGQTWKIYKPIIGKLGATQRIADFAVSGNKIFAATARNTSVSEDATIYGIWVTENEGENWHLLLSADQIGQYLPYYEALKILTHRDTLFVAVASNTYGAHRILLKMPIGSLKLAIAKGITYTDVNRNAILDNEEKGIANVIVELSPQKYVTASDTMGFYNLNAKIGDTIRVNPIGRYQKVKPEYHIVTENSRATNFGIYTPVQVTDLSVTMNTPSVFRPGFETELFITVKNEGTTTQKPTIRFDKDTNLIWVRAFPIPSELQSTFYRWDNLDSLQPQQSLTLKITVKTSLKTEIRTSITAITSVGSNSQDETPNDNLFILKNAVVGSYDPNDKLVSPDVYTPNDIIKRTPLTYTIRFQNTGNYPASFVVLEDSLSPLLDISTLKMIAASHPYKWRVYDKGILEVRFDDINLPDSIRNEAGSHGFVSFSIQPRKEIALGMTLQNRAYIYFDYNSPIITNWSVSHVKDTTTLKTTLQELANPPEWSVSPNPTSGFIHLKLSTPIESLAVLYVFDTHKRLILQKQITDSVFDLDLTHLNNGIYFLAVKNGAKYSTNRLVLIK